jgi:dynein light chain Tctex-type 1
VSSSLPQSIDPILGKQVYTAKKIHDWTSAIVESVLKSLQAVNKPFKYVVTCIIMQKNGAGLHTASTCFWDTKTDGSCSVRWDNQTMHAIVTVFALHI